MSSQEINESYQAIVDKFGRPIVVELPDVYVVTKEMSYGDVTAEVGRIIHKNGRYTFMLVATPLTPYQMIPVNHAHISDDSCDYYGYVKRVSDVKELLPYVDHFTTGRFASGRNIREEVLTIVRRLDKDHVHDLEMAETMIKQTLPFRISGSELQSGVTRIHWAEALILSMLKHHPSHDGARSWLLNYGVGETASKLRDKHGLSLDEGTKSAVKLKVGEDK